MRMASRLRQHSEIGKFLIFGVTRRARGGLESIRGREESCRGKNYFKSLGRVVTAKGRRLVEQPLRPTLIEVSCESPRLELV